MEIAIILLYLAFAFLDSIAQIPKYIGGLMSLGGVGFTISNIIHTIKRIFVVSYPPVIAIFLLSHDLDDLFKVIYICYFGASLIAAIVYVKRGFFEKYLSRQIHAFGSGGSLWRFWQWEDGGESGFEVRGFQGISFDPKLFFSALWIYFFFGSVFFLVNVLGYIFSNYSSVILQLSGFFNAMGTLILAFYLDPSLARVFERDQSRAHLALQSVLLAQIVNFLLISPAFFFAISFLI